MKRVKSKIKFTLIRGECQSCDFILQLEQPQFKKYVPD
jgi:hypothetical protein